MRIVDFSEMALIDAHAQEQFHMPALLLMEQAGQALWRRLKETHLVSGDRILVIIGAGNNGGDALVVARLAYQQGFGVDVVALKMPHKNPAAQQVLMVKALGIGIINWKEDSAKLTRLLPKCNWIIDGITGSGLRTAVREEYRPAIKAINACGAPKVAIDVPSGIYMGFAPSDIAVRADITLTVELAKLEMLLPHARPYCGSIEIIPIGFPHQLVHRPSKRRLIGAMCWVPPSVWVHKYGRGVVNVIAGSGATFGAAVLAADGAASTGAGLVHTVLDRVLVEAMQTARPSYITHAIEDWDSRPNTTSSTPAAVIGPGWGQHGREPYLKHYLECLPQGVLDADALHVLRSLRKKESISLKGRWVLTPHMGECAALCQVTKEELGTEPIRHLQKLAQELQAVVVLKSYTSIVVSADGDIDILDNPNPLLATGGSGDVLAGMIAAIMAQGLPPFEAAGTGVWLHANAARQAGDTHGVFIAQQLTNALSQVVGDYFKAHQLAPQKRDSAKLQR